MKIFNFGLAWQLRLCQYFDNQQWLDCNISSYLQEFHLSITEQRFIQELELRIMTITYKEIVTEDGELMVTAAPTEAVQPSFDTPVKNYRIREGMGVTFHCKMGGMPLPKVLQF